MATRTKTTTRRGAPSATTATLLSLLVAAGACQTDDRDEAPSGDAAGAAAGTPGWDTPQEPDDRLFVVEGLSGPEAVKYDPDQDVYIVSNFGEGGDSRANDGFLARVSAEDGAVESLRWATGPDHAPLRQPLGMALDGDTLWVVDSDGVHAFHRVSGEHMGFVDMTGLGPGFLNDAAVGGDGALYVTDTGASRVYRVADGAATLVAEGDDLGSPNGITWDAAAERFLLVPWQGGDSIRAWDSATGDLTLAARTPGARFDGVEAVPGGFLVASQADSAIHVVVGAAGRPVITLPGRPADIAVDSRRGRVAVPYIALNRVDVFALPAGQPGATAGTDGGEG
jgi:hypothetical protein